MADDKDDSQKTEQPTQKRLDDAVKRGSVPFSREVTSFLMLVVFAFVIIALLPGMMHKAAIDLSAYISKADQFIINETTILNITQYIVQDLLKIMALPVLILVMVIVISAILQHGFVVSFESIMPQLERISPLAGFKRIFSMRQMVEFIKGLLKITLVGTVAFIAVYPELAVINKVITGSVFGILLFLLMLAKRMLIGVLSALFIIAVLDFLYQKFEYLKSMRMSKQEIKEEFKQTEGSPEIKAKLRELRNKRASKRMMADVPKADVIITNPTHYAVALKYERQKTEAPVLVAKGKDLIALKIRELAKENKVPIVENPPLARALYDSVEIGAQIPVTHYNAVAEIIWFVYKLKGIKNRVN